MPALGAFQAAAASSLASKFRISDPCGHPSASAPETPCPKLSQPRDIGVSLWLDLSPCWGLPRPCQAPAMPSKEFLGNGSRPAAV